MKNSTWKAVGTLGIVVALCLLLGGCGTSDFPSVSGTVTLDGAPLSGVSVSFEPKGTDGTSASGKTDSSGRYTLISTADLSGAKPGEYIVRIRSPEPAIFGVNDESEDDKAEPNYEFSEPYVNAVPEKYGPNSELTATVQAGKNTIDFELQSD